MRCRLSHNPEEAADALRSGRVVGMPTETVYGLAGNAFDPRTVAEIFQAKERPHFDPLIVHVPSLDSISDVASDFPPLAQRLAAAFWPGPLTMVLPKTSRIPEIVTSGLATVGVRMPDHPLMRRVLELTGFPLAAPSANLFGRLSPTTANHVIDQLGDRIDLVLDGGPCRVGVESTILHIHGDKAVLLRHGGIPLEAIESLIGPIQVAQMSEADTPLAPGQLPSHYAPRTPLRVVEKMPIQAPGDRIGALLPSAAPIHGYQHIEVLATDGDLPEAAARFFPAMHRLDELGLQLILAQSFAEVGLGRALNDRLRRAAD